MVTTVTPNDGQRVYLQKATISCAGIAGAGVPMERGRRSIASMRAQSAGAERLRDQVVGAGGEPEHDIGLVALAGEHDDVGVAVA